LTLKSNRRTFYRVSAFNGPRPEDRNVVRKG